ncbi:hypothetical protein EJB05_21501, partial [Eragrostis curvula]
NINNSKKLSGSHNILQGTSLPFREIDHAMFLSSMKLQRQLSMTKLLDAARDLLVLMARTKLPLLAVGSAVVAKCRELWERLITRGGSRARAADDDYFRWSYEFSCTTTPVNAPAVKGRHRRRLPPCIGGRLAREMMLASVTPRDEAWSPEPGTAGHEIDGLAEEFINRFREQLRMQGVA